MAVVSMSYLLESGVHFGHQTKRWNPKMKEYIYTSRDGIYIIDLQKTAKKIEEAYEALKVIAEQNGKVLFVGTRKQAQEAVREEAIRSESFYVTERWLGGTLTNFKTIRGRVRRMEIIEKMETDGTFDKLPKKEVIGLKKEHEKLDKLLSGIRDMYKLPKAMIIVDPSKEEIAIKEARKLNIPIFGVVDTNCDPDMVDYVIPANDDAIRAVKLIMGVLANAIVEVNGGVLTEFVKEEDKSGDSKDIMEKALETVKRKEDRRPRFDRRDYRKPYNDNRGYKKPYAEKREFKKETTEYTKPVVQEKVVEYTKPVVQEKVTEKIEKPEIKEDKNISTLTVAELRDLAKTKSIKGYSTMKKAELIDALK